MFSVCGLQLLILSLPVCKLLFACWLLLDFIAQPGWIKQSNPHVSSAPSHTVKLTCGDAPFREDKVMCSTDLCCCGNVRQLLLSLVANVLQLTHRVVHTGDLSLHSLGHTRRRHLSQPADIATARSTSTSRSWMLDDTLSLAQNALIYLKLDQRCRCVTCDALKWYATCYRSCKQAWVRCASSMQSTEVRAHHKVF